MLESFRLDRAGVAELLKSQPMADLVNEAADKVAANVRGALPEQAEVDVEHYTSDRRRATVMIKHPASAGWQAQDKILTRAAESAGLEVTEQ